MAFITEIETQVSAFGILISTLSKVILLMYIMPYLNLIYGLSSASCPQQKNYIQPTLLHNRSVKVF